ncbi:MAG: APC family permease [Spirochaetia bacterium]|jgi:amino acid transporter|nr:APC family permease [Spirochaetia bacterium]
MGVVIVLGAAIGFSGSDFRHLEPLFAPDTQPIAGMLPIIAVAPFAFVGFDTVPQASEEFLFDTRQCKKIMKLAIFFGFLIYIAVNTATAIVFPWYDFISKPSEWYTADAVAYVLGRGGVYILSICILAALLSGVLAFYMAASRLLFAIGRENGFSFFAKLNQKNGTPENAIVFTLMYSLFAPFFGRTVTSWIFEVASIGTAIGYLYTCLSCHKFSKKDGNRRQATKALIGSLFSCSFIALLLIPGTPSFLSIPSRIITLGWVILGSVFLLTHKRNFLGKKSDRRILDH